MVDEGQHSIFSHDNIHSQVVVDGVYQFLLGEALCQNAFLQDVVVHTHAISIPAHLFQHLVYLGSEVVHGFSFVAFEAHTFLGLLHQIETLSDVVHRDLVGKSETSLNKNMITLA